MTVRINNTPLLKKLVLALGSRGEARLEIGADISRSTVRDILKGKLPSRLVRQRVAVFLNYDAEKLFPFLDLDQEIK